MDYWQRVDVEDSTEDQTATGAVVLTWVPMAGGADVEARVLPLDTTEDKAQWATPEEDAYEVQLRGSIPVRPRMRLRVGTDYYDVREVKVPPPFGEPSTVLLTVRVTP